MSQTEGTAKALGWVRLAWLLQRRGGSVVMWLRPGRQAMWVVGKKGQELRGRHCVAAPEARARECFKEGVMEDMSDLYVVMGPHRKKPRVKEVAP